MVNNVNIKSTLLLFLFFITTVPLKWTNRSLN